MKAHLSDDRRFVTLEGATWRDRWPVEALPGWLKFYRRLRDRNGGKRAQCYAPTVAALEEVARQLAQESAA